MNIQFSVIQLSIWKVNKMIKNTIILGLLLILFLSCEQNTKSNTEVFGDLKSFSNCKILNKVTGLSKIVETLPDTLAGIEYHYDGKSKLTLTHINAGFNCCPGELFTEITANNNQITIEEFETESVCDCDCLYDLFIEIDDIEPGNYSFSVLEPYLPENNENIYFILGLNKNNSGLITFKRHGYPWG